MKQKLLLLLLTLFAFTACQDDFEEFGTLTDELNENVT
jgi:hypothetical protein